MCTSPGEVFRSSGASGFFKDPGSINISSRWVEILYSISQMLAEERRDLPGIQRLPWHFSQRVVPARHPHHIQFQPEFCHTRDHVAREIDRECQIVARGYEAHRPLL